MQNIRNGKDIIVDIDPRKDTFIHTVMKYTKFNFRSELKIANKFDDTMVTIDELAEVLRNKHVNDEIPDVVKNCFVPVIGFTIFHNINQDETISLIHDNFKDDLAILGQDIIKVLFELSDIDVEGMLETIGNLWLEAEIVEELEDVKAVYEEIIQDFYDSLDDLNESEPEVLNKLFKTAYSDIGYLLMRSSTIEILRKQHAPDFNFDIDGKPGYGVSTVLGQTYIFKEGISIKK